jgi:hypothetical protein
MIFLAEVLLVMLLGKKVFTSQSDAVFQISVRPYISFAKNKEIRET